MIISSNFNFSLNTLSKPNVNKYVNFNTPLKSDVFTRSVSFKHSDNDDMSFEEFAKWAEENDFLSKVSDLVEVSGKVLGSGFEGTTFEIPNTDKWVIKEYKRGNFLPISLTEPQIIKIKDFAPELNVGQTISKVEIPHGKNYSSIYYILKKQKGEAHGVSFDESDKINEFNIKIHLNSLKALNDLPQDSFDKCIENICRIDTLGYEFDCSNPNNFLIDKENKRINFVDINDLNTKNKNPYGDVLFALLGGYFGINFLSSDTDPELKNTAREYSYDIINKYFNSMAKYGKKFDDNSYFKSLLDSDILNGVLNCESRDSRLNGLRKINLL